jgi:hypothetical protein
MEVGLHHVDRLSFFRIDCIYPSINLLDYKLTHLLQNGNSTEKLIGIQSC